MLAMSMTEARNGIFRGCSAVLGLSASQLRAGGLNVHLDRKIKKTARKISVEVVLRNGLRNV